MKYAERRVLSTKTCECQHDDRPCGGRVTRIAEIGRTAIPLCWNCAKDLEMAIRGERVS